MKNVIKSAIKGAIWRIYPEYFISRFFRDAARTEFESRIVHCFMSKREGSIDVGAHGAQYTSIMSVHSRAVLAFEPIPHLARGIESFDMPNVTVIAAAASEDAGQLTLYIPKDDGGNLLTPIASLEPSTLNGQPFETVEVPTVRLDDICSDPVSFIKIDAEGAELRVLRGATRTLAANRPILMMEANGTEELADQSDFMRSNEYDAFHVADGVLNPTRGVPQARDGTIINNHLYFPRDGSRDREMRQLRSFLG